MIAFDPTRLQQFLDRNSDRRATAPDADDMGRDKSGFYDLIGERERQLKQFVRIQIALIVQPNAPMP